MQKILPGQYVLSVYLSISTTVMNFEGITHANRLAWEIMLYSKAVPSSCVLGETVLIHLLLAVVLPSVPLLRAGTSTGCADVLVLSASPSLHP